MARRNARKVKPAKPLRAERLSRRTRLIVIVGPTTAGKSELAVRLARRWNGEVISADSRQVYRDLDIGTGKISRRGMRGVPHHLLGVADPRRQFSVIEFQRLAHRAIRDIAGRGKLPILVGGTGFWVDAVAHDLALPNIPPDPKLRKRLGKKRPIELLPMLRRLDPERAKRIEPENPRRIIRAIEIASALGRVPQLEKRSPYRALWIGLKPPQPILRRKITAFAVRILRRGLARETETLLRRGASRSRLAEFGFEYRATLAYLAGRISRSELRARLIRDLRAYARRQMAWFRRNPGIRWVAGRRDAERIVRGFLRPGISARRRG